MENTIISSQFGNIKRKIFEVAKPKKIILFGSYANNNQKEYSDLDLCVVIGKMSKRAIDITREIRQSLLEILDMPLDILVYDASNFEKRKKHPYSFENTIESEGIILYEKDSDK